MSGRVVYRDDQEALQLRLAALERQARRAEQLEERVRELEDENRELAAKIPPPRVVESPGLVDGEIYLDERVARYIDAIVAATRAPDLANRVLSGARPVDALRVADAARSYARGRKRPYVTPDDVKEVARVNLPTRIIVASSTESAAAIIDEILDRTEVP